MQLVTAQLSTLQSSITSIRLQELARLRRNIRAGEEPDNPSLLVSWLALENDGQENMSLMQRRACYESQFAFLLETVVDELVVAHWRCTCLDNIYRPLQSLKQISDSIPSHDQIQRLIRELAMQSRYVRYSLRF